MVTLAFLYTFLFFGEVISLRLKLKDQFINKLINLPAITIIINLITDLIVD